MAKYEKVVKGEFQVILENVQNQMERNGMKVLEKSKFRLDDTEIVILIYKKFYLRNLSRAILNLTLIGKGDTTHITAIIYGGEQGIAIPIDNGAEEDLLIIVQECMEQIV